MRHEGSNLFRAGKYLAAIQVYESGYGEARRRQDARSALRFLNNLGSVNYQLLRYRDAVKVYLQARTLATSLKDQEMLAAICFNLSSLYFQMGEIDAATESAKRGLELPVGASAKFRPQLLIQSALIEMRQRNWDRATAWTREAIEVSRAQLDVAAEAQAWNELGNALLEWNRLPASEEALLESFRLRKLTHDERLHFSYESLAELRLSQNNPASALAFLNRAIESAAPLGPAAVWRPLYGRGRANLALDRLTDAYSDIAASIQNLQDWRAEVLPADAFRVSTEVKMHEIYAAFIEVAGRLYRQTGQMRYAEESFAVAEDGRTASLRMLWATSDLPKQLPQEYWLTLSDLQKAEAARLRAGPEDGAVRRLRLKLAEMEAATGLELPAALADNDPGGRRLLQITRQSLGPDGVFLGFHTGKPGSWLWVVTRKGLEFLALPSEDELKKDIGDFVQALRQSSPEARVLGQRLYQRLFGQIAPNGLNMPTWIIDADGPLFELPFAALVEGASPEPGASYYVIERHAIRIVPGVSALLRSPPSEWNEMFVGVGDPIYNRADPRLVQGPKPSAVSSTVEVSAADSAPGIMELPRLFGSAREVDNCAKIWQSKGAQWMVLKGPAANKGELAQALRNNPSVVHVAAHMLFPPQGAGGGMVALSLQSGRQIELLSDTETAGMRAKLGLVVLNGCSSGQAAVLPGAGLMGMSRAWLAAGAHAVILTRWPISDRESGAVFLSLYQLYFLHRADGPVSFGVLLRKAQLEELHAGGARADPARWASYFCVETN
jgi:CHAT domain-containing protein